MESAKPGASMHFGPATLDMIKATLDCAYVVESRPQSTAIATFHLKNSLELRIGVDGQRVAIVSPHARVSLDAVKSTNRKKKTIIFLCSSSAQNPCGIYLAVNGADATFSVSNAVSQDWGALQEANVKMKANISQAPVTATAKIMMGQK